MIRTFFRRQARDELPQYDVVKNRGGTGRGKIQADGSHFSFQLNFTRDISYATLLRVNAFSSFLMLPKPLLSKYFRQTQESAITPKVW